MSILSEVKTYSCDEELFRKLKLKPFCFDMDKVKNRVRVVGKVKTDNGSVKIWVEGHPAQFWKFEVVDKDGGNKYLIETGSGSLSDYWPAIEKMANNMFVIKSIEKRIIEEKKNVR